MKIIILVFITIFNIVLKTTLCGDKDYDPKFYPGIYAKIGATFEYAPLSNGVKAIEAGVMIDAYHKTIPIMAFAKNKQVFFNFYLTIMLGKKW